MNPAECDYWDKVAVYRKRKGYITDNVWKRGAIISRLFKLNWYKQRILEIGVGYGTAAAALKVIFLDTFKYVGTDVSKEYCEWGKKFFGLNMVNTDILDLPKIEGGFTRVIALDTLEHVKPEERDQGYKNIGEVMAENAQMVINMPMNPTLHIQKFDHPFGVQDIVRLCELAKMEMMSFETYRVNATAGPLFYGWAVLQRGDGNGRA